MKSCQFCLLDSLKSLWECSFNLREGDPNTELFHLHARHRRKNFIGKISDGDQVLTTHEDKERVIYNFYNGLLGTSLHWEHTINLDELNIASHNLSCLEIAISEEEVWRTISDLPSEKAPGPAGFTDRFYQVCWPIIKNDIMAAISAV